MLGDTLSFDTETKSVRLSLISLLHIEHITKYGKNIIENTAFFLVWEKGNTAHSSTLHSEQNTILKEHSLRQRWNSSEEIVVHHGAIGPKCVLRGTVLRGVTRTESTVPGHR